MQNPKKSVAALAATAIATALVAQSSAGECEQCCPSAGSSNNHSASTSTVSVETESLLALPSDLPGSFSVAVPHSGQHLTLHLKKNKVFGENTRILVADGSGSLTEVQLGPDRSYLGRVAEQTNYTVSAVLTEKGLIATIIRPGEESITVAPLKATKAGLLHTIAVAQSADHTGSPRHSTNGVAHSMQDPAETAASDGPIVSSPTPSGPAGAPPEGSTASLPPTRVMDVLEYEIGVEIGSNAFLSSTYNSNLATAEASAQSLIGNLDARYLRGAGIKHRLGTVIIRTDAATDPLTSITSNASSGLTAFRDYWNSHSGEVGTTHDLAVYHVRASPSGRAYVNSVGSSNRYALSCGNGATSWADGTIVHEFGHSWNLRHTGDAPISEYDYGSGATPPSSFYEAKPRNNSGSSTAGGNHTFVSVMHGSGDHNINRLSSDEANNVYGIRQGKRSYGDVVADPGDIPPFGRRDSAIASGNAITIDVIANDYDANNDVLEALLLDTVSHKGGTITLSPGSGPGTRNELIYTPPAAFTGIDFFHYTVCDTTGLTDWGIVYVDNLGPVSIDLDASKYHYDLGTPTSPVFTGSSDTYARVSDFTYGDLGFTSGGPNPVESRDRAENGPISGVNDINRDHIRMRSPGAFHHKLAAGVYDVLFTIGDALENTASIKLTAEGSEIITTASHAPAAFTNYTFQDLLVTDGELNIDIENLGFSANITRIAISRVGVIVDTSRTAFNYDLGSLDSPVQSDWTQLTPLVAGDIHWTGSAIDSVDRGYTPGVNNINRDFVFGSGSSTLNHKLANGTWNITLNMGDLDFAHDQMEVRAEGTTLGAGVNSAAGAFPYVTGQVVVSDNELNLEFLDNGGSDPNWVVTRLSLARVDGDLDGDGYSDYLEIAAGTNPEDPLSKPELSSWALAGHWPMDESSGGIAADASGLNHHASWAGSPEENTWVTGLIGGAAQVNDEDGGSGQEHFRIANLSSLNGAAGLSLSLWINQNVASNNNSTNNGILTTRELRSTLGSGSGENWGMALETNNSPRHIDWRVNGTPHPETDNIIGNIVDEWHHLLYVWDGASGTVSLYQNGVLVQSSTTATGSILTGGEWRIGDDACCGSREFTGTFDDVAVFGEALNAGDAAIVYQAGLSGYPISDLVGSGPTPPVVSTGGSANVVQTSADISFGVTDDGGEAPTMTLYYGQSNGGTTPGNWDDSQGIGSRPTGSFSTPLSSLLPNTTYYYRIYGSNSAGEDWGTSQSFTTSAYDYSTWAADNSVTGGANDDDDQDNISNLVEYALGLNPQLPDSSTGSFDGSLLSFTKGSEAVTNGDLTYFIETSPNLLPPWTKVTPDTNNGSTISFTLPAGQGTLFGRLRVERN